MGFEVIDYIHKTISKWKTNIGRMSYYEVLNTFSAPVYFLTISGGWYYGVWLVLPWYYKGFSQSFLFFHQVLGTIICSEMMMNWICIRFVDSSYLDRKTKQEEYTELLESAVRNQTNNNGKSKGIVLQCKYWSWAPCLVCKQMRPPRCHHCPLCEKCVLKRDHHCYFAGRCVGFYNQRHFVVFCFWAIVACLYGGLHSFTYMTHEMWPHIRLLDLLFPVAIIRAIFGYINLQIAILVFVGNMIAYFAYQSSMFLLDMTSLISRGITQFEEANIHGKKMIVADKRSTEEKIASVFGKYWILNFVIPLHFVLPPVEDPFSWPHTNVTTKSS